MIADLAAHRVIGKGPAGYRDALAYLAGTADVTPPRAPAPARLELRAARHRPRQRPLPDGLRELERRAARRPRRAGDALHRLPLPRGGRRRCAGVEVELTTARAHRRPRRAAERPARLRGRQPRRRAVETLRRRRARARPDARRRRGAARGQGRRRDRADPARERSPPSARSRRSTAETWVGRSERELAWRLRELLHAHGVDELAFDTVIASGANGSRPHAQPGRRPRRAAQRS